MKQWKNVELKDKEKFRKFLLENGIYFEVSAAYNLYHFEILVDSEEEKRCNEFLENTNKENE